MAFMEQFTEQSKTMTACTAKAKLSA